MIDRQKSTALRMLISLLLPLGFASAQQSVWTLTDYKSFYTTEAARIHNVSFDSTAGDGAIFLAPSTENFALGGAATDDIGNASRNNPNNVIDGNPATFWHSPDERTTGIGITLDLKAVRTIDEVRIVGTMLDTINFRIKGYLIELSLDGDAWSVVAKNENNPVRKDVIEVFEPFVAQYVRVTIIKTDLKNWTFIGEIEVYGSGYASTGYYISEIKDFSKKVNYGIASWDVDLPQGTEFSMQFRSDSLEIRRKKIVFRSGIDTLWLNPNIIPGSEYLRNVSGDVIYSFSFDYVVDYESGLLTRLTTGILAPKDTVVIDYKAWGYWTEKFNSPDIQFKVAEPRQYLQFKANFQTRSLNTPMLNQVDIYYSKSPIANRAIASIAPDTVIVLKQATLSYTFDLQFDEGDQGIDTLVINTPTASKVTNVRFNNQSVAYTNHSTSKNLIVAFNSPLKAVGNAQLVVDFSSTLIQTDNSFPSYIVSAKVADNYQFVEKGKWKVKAIGIPEAPLLRVEVAPNPFSPNNDGVCDFTTITFYIAKISHAQSLQVKIYNLNNDLIRVLHDEYSPADFYQIQWDGRDENQQLVLPGVYIFQVRVNADAGDFYKTRLITVMY
ncbi:discoidin domain-containing protein [candidate division KSB1 bacterium]|nr:discoidin domain-containing protein [candidate division KSB1 bacterium]